MTTRTRSVWTTLADNNAFYLLSAASMLLACLLLSNSTSWEPIAFSRLTALVATLGVYELIVTLLGVYLIAARKLARDGIMLLTLEAFFLADIGFLSSEAYQQSLYSGLLLNAILFLAGLFKLLLIFHALRIPIASPAFGLVVMSLAVLLGHPAWLKFLGDAHHGRVSEMAMYGLWWTLAALLATWGVLLKHLHWRFFRGATLLRAAIVHLMLGVLLASLIAHIATAHWVFNVPFRAMHLSPILLGGTVLLASVPHSKFFAAPEVRALCVLMPALAILLSGHARHSASLTLLATQLTPVLFAIAGAYVAVVYAFAQRHMLSLLSVGIVAAVGYTMLPSWDTIAVLGTRTLRRLSELASRVIPRTQFAWGLIALLGSFTLLAIGAAFSLRRPSVAAPQPAPDPPHV